MPTSFIYLPLLNSSPLPLTPRPASQLDAFRNSILAETNANRRENGCDDLTPNALLTQDAQGHSKDIALNDYFSHINLNGESFSDRISATIPGLAAATCIWRPLADNPNALAEESVRFMRRQLGQ